MRIALIAPLVSPIAPPYLGGAQALLADLAAGLGQRGHQVTLFAAAGSAVPAPGVVVRDLGIDSSQLTPARFTGPLQAKPPASGGEPAQAGLAGASPPGARFRREGEEGSAAPDPIRIKLISKRAIF